MTKDELVEAQQKLKEGDVNTALTISKRLYQADKTLATIMAYSHILIQIGQTEEAALILQEGDQLFPDNPNIHHNLGFLFMKREEWQKAHQVYKNLYAQGLRSEASLWNLGICLMRLKNFSGAKQVLQETVQSYPQSIEPKVDLAVCYFEAKEIERARVILEEVLRVDEHHQRAGGLLYEIEKDSRGKTARFYKGDKED